MRKDYKKYFIEGYEEASISDIILVILLVILPMYNTFMAVAFISYSLLNNLFNVRSRTYANILDKFYLIKRR